MAAYSNSQKKKASGESDENLWPEQPPIVKADKNPTYKTVPCKNFSKSGYCSYGPVCQFMHGLMDYKGGVGAEKKIPEAAKGNLKTIPCQKYSLLGTCTEGSKCQFKHGDIPSKSFKDMDRPGVPRLYKTAPCRHFAMTGYCSFGVTCRFLHGRERSTNQNYKTVPCQNWNNTGSCSYGDVCQFLHGQADPAVIANVGAQAMIGNKGASAQIGGPPFISTMTPVQAFSTNAHFKTIGDSYQYAHGENVQQQNWGYERAYVVPNRNFSSQQSYVSTMGIVSASRKPNYKTVMCRHFARNGRCLMGSMCDFKHDEDGPANVKAPGLSAQPGFNPNYKTVPCRNWSTTGTCSYEKVCQFKHGED